MNGLFNHFSHLLRAIQIAIVGNFKVAVFADLNEYSTCMSDFEIIRSWLYPYFDGFASNGEIHIELTKPYSTELLSVDRLSDQDLSSIIDAQSKAESVFLVNYNRTDSINLLLKTAVNKLNLSIQDMQFITKIAKAIAKLDSSKTVNIAHVAEAIQYRSISEGFNLLNPTIKFGDHITINRGVKIESEEAVKAIEYLNKFI